MNTFLNIIVIIGAIYFIVSPCIAISRGMINDRLDESDFVLVIFWPIILGKWLWKSFWKVIEE